MDEKEFVELISRYQRGKVSEDEKRLVEDWLHDRSRTNAHASLTEEEKEQIKVKVLNTILLKVGASSNKRENKSSSYLFRIAAAVSLLAVITYSILFFSGFEFSTPTHEEQQAQIVKQGEGDITKVMLGDGSIVWLKGKSTLAYPPSFETKIRNVTLQGEALFEVQKDPSRPFTIQCGDLTTTVLGTSFNIKATENDIQVVVLTGQVALTSGTDDYSIVVLPDEKAVYDMANKKLTKVGSHIESTVANGIVIGTQYDMNFNDTRMSEIAERIEGKFDIRVRFEDDNLENCVVTANLTGQPLSMSLDILSSVLNFDYKIEKDTITLAGEGCK